MLNYGLMVDKGSMFNTPNTFGIYALDAMFRWMESMGGLTEIGRINQMKADALYAELDRTDFWVPFADVDSRSQMNVTWNIHRQDLEPVFIAKAEREGLKALKGHRSIGGIRASIYNATTQGSVDKLVDFMKRFEANHG